MFTTDERMIAGVKAMYPAGTKIVLDSILRTFEQP